MTFYDVGPVVIASLRKNASQAIRHTLFKFLEVREYPIHEVEGLGKPIYGFIRQPIDRLQSCFRYFSNQGWTVDRTFETYPQFVDAVLDGLKNPHWDSQVEQLTYGGRYLPTVTYRFEDLSRVWIDLGLAPLHVRNASRWCETGDYRRQELDNLFSEDLEKYGQATENSHTKASATGRTAREAQGA
jgi:hypothetical protein